MANQNNYLSDISVASQGYTRFSVSRIVSSPSDNLVEMEVAADFPTEIPEANIEIALYSLADNTLVYYDYITNNQIDTLITKRLQYKDNTLRKFVVIDFSKLRDFTLPIGTYSATLSFLVNELGSYDTAPLRIKRISPSRTEVELELIDETQKQKMINLVTPKITNMWIGEVLQQIFNQSGSGELPPVSPVRIDTGSIQTALGQQATAQIARYGFDVDFREKPGVYTVAQTVLDKAYPLAVSEVSKYLIEGNTFLDKETLLTIVNNALDDAFQEVYDDENKNPEKYRYNII